MGPMLAGVLDFVIGVDTHRDTHTAAIVNATTGGVIEHLTFPTDTSGYRRLHAFAEQHAPGTRVWAIEGTGSYGSGLTTALLEAGERVVEIDRPSRPARRDGAKSDDLDAVRAAREALSRDHLAGPRARGDREALRVLMAARQGAVTARTKAISQLKALIVSAPQALRDQLRSGTTSQQVHQCARLRSLPRHSIEYRATIHALRGTARRALALQAEAAEYETELEQLVEAICPVLLEQPGIGTISGAQFLISWSHAGRIRSHAAFASLGGAAPIPASSGTITRYRLNRTGDRQLNRALHTVAMTRLRIHEPTQAYTARRTAEGKTPREIRRCLKRAIAREVFRIMTRHAQDAVAA